jgi:hypothetical protein
MMLTGLTDRATRGSSPSNRDTRKWLESTSSNLKTTYYQVLHPKVEEGLASQLYSLCRSTLRDLCVKKECIPTRSAQSVLLQEELTKLYLWGESFGPGELDIALEYSDDTRYSVLDTLGDVGRLLLRGKKQKRKEDYILLGWNTVHMGIGADLVLQRSRVSQPRG